MYNAKVPSKDVDLQPPGRPRIGRCAGRRSGGCAVRGRRRRGRRRRGRYGRRGRCGHGRHSLLFPEQTLGREVLEHACASREPRAVALNPGSGVDTRRTVQRSNCKTTLNGNSYLNLRWPIRTTIRTECPGAQRSYEAVLRRAFSGMGHARRILGCKTHFEVLGLAEALAAPKAVKISYLALAKR